VEKEGERGRDGFFGGPDQEEAKTAVLGKDREKEILLHSLLKSRKIDQ
jgi:hypothetical protein